MGGTGAELASDPILQDSLDAFHAYRGISDSLLVGDNDRLGTGRGRRRGAYVDHSTALDLWPHITRSMDLNSSECTCAYWPLTYSNLFGLLMVERVLSMGGRKGRSDVIRYDQRLFVRL